VLNECYLRLRCDCLSPLELAATRWDKPRGVLLMPIVLVLCVLSVSLSGLSAAELDGVFGELRLVQEINCGEPASVPFAEHPADSSQVVRLLDSPHRVLPTGLAEPSYFAYRIGGGLGLKPGAAYVLAVDVPEDAPRSMFIGNWGCETMRGIHTGASVGDILKGRYTNHNVESLQVPLSGDTRVWTQLFWLHDRFPELNKPRGRSERPLLPADGFWVVIAQGEGAMHPLSAGPAAARIRLYEVEDEAALATQIPWPSEGLPRRHLFWREEMADGVVAMGHKASEKDPKLRGVTDPVDWYEYKMKLMGFLGMDTFSKDLLEFGHNQGWDASSVGGGSAWYNASSVPDRWQRILERVARHRLSVLPYYEYAGSVGQNKALAIGSQRRCRALSGEQDYTHITWCHKTNADLADPDFSADAQQVLRLTVGRYADKVDFLGAWFRPRPEANPISFNDANLARFASEANQDTAVSREQLRADRALLDRYYTWWFGKRREWLEAQRDYLRSAIGDEAVVLYTADASEPGLSLPGNVTGLRTAVVTDDVPAWQTVLGAETYRAKRFAGIGAVSYADVLSKGMYRNALLRERGTWGKWEWQHACPRNDPETYRAAEGVALTYSFNRRYTVADPQALADFTFPTGLAMVRHYSLNENEMSAGKQELLGYFVADVERAGPASMASEVLALANGNPRYIGYLAGNSFNRGYAAEARRFNLNFLALPALPMVTVPEATRDSEVVLRRIDAGDQGTWLAVINSGFAAKKGLRVRLPKGVRAVETAVGGDAVPVRAGRITLDLDACELLSLRVR
jgi:hypothetical protein